MRASLASSGEEEEFSGKFRHIWLSVDARRAHAALAASPRMVSAAGVVEATPCGAMAWGGSRGDRVAGVTTLGAGLETHVRAKARTRATPPENATTPTGSTQVP